jgi:AcrR family transcriptional regulator
MARQDTRTERKNIILDAAATTFARHGFHQSRMDDIVQESGLSKGAIYWYFKSKDDIILELMKRIFDQEMDYFKALIDEEGNTDKRLLDFVRRVVADIREIDRSGILPLFYEFYATATREEPVRTFISEYYHVSHLLVGELVQQGIDRGEFRAVDAHSVALSIIATWEGVVLLWAIHRSMIDLEQQMLDTMQLIIEGLRARDASHTSDE